MRWLQAIAEWWGRVVGRGAGTGSLLLSLLVGLVLPAAVLVAAVLWLPGAVVAIVSRFWSGPNEGIPSRGAILGVMLAGALLVVLVVVGMAQLPTATARRWVERFRPHWFALILLALLLIRWVSDLVPFPGGVRVEGRAYFLDGQAALCGLLGLSGLLALAAAVFLRNRTLGPLLGVAVAIGLLAGAAVTYPFNRPAGAMGVGLAALEGACLVVQALRYLVCPLAGVLGLSYTLALALLISQVVRGRRTLPVLALAGWPLILFIAQLWNNLPVLQAPVGPRGKDPAGFASSSAFNASRALDYTEVVRSIPWARVSLQLAVDSRQPEEFLRAVRALEERQALEDLSLALHSWVELEWLTPPQRLDGLVELLEMVERCELEEELDDGLEAALRLTRTIREPEERLNRMLACSVLALRSRRQRVFTEAIDESVRAAVESKRQEQALEVIWSAGKQLGSPELLKAVAAISGTVRWTVEDQVRILLGCAKVGLEIGQSELAGSFLESAHACIAEAEHPVVRKRLQKEYDEALKTHRKPKR